MKAIFKSLVFLLLIWPMASFALSLGDMVVKSALNEPFDAEVELLDLDSIPLAEIKVGLASVPDFERVGLERAYVLDLLNFKVKLSKKGKPIIRIRSIERINEPFLEMVIDVAWASGQIYRVYTVLLDPPGYKIEFKATPVIRKELTSRYKGSTGVIEKEIISSPKESAITDLEVKSEKTYGPTKDDETIWQIAQRYKGVGNSLNQVILAIVGTNPQSFKDGNLNGLQAGVVLKIPSSDIIANIPDDLAKLEVIQHDKAWHNRREIEHVLAPPYINAQPYSEDIEQSESSMEVTSVLPTVPEMPVSQNEAEKGYFGNILPRAKAILSLSEDNDLKISKQKPAAQNTTSIEVSVAEQAIKSVRETNYLLNEQLKTIAEKNKRLEDMLAKRTEEINELKEQIRLLSKRQAIAGQGSSTKEEESSIIWWLLLTILSAILAAGIFYWWTYVKRFTIKKEPSSMDEPPLAKAYEQTETESNDVDVVITESEEESTSERDEYQNLDEPISEEPLRDIDAKESLLEVEKNKEQESLTEEENVDKLDDEPIQKEQASPENYLLDFESTLEDEGVVEDELEPEEQLDSDENSIEFTTDAELLNEAEDEEKDQENDQENDPTEYKLEEVPEDKTSDTPEDLKEDSLIKSKKAMELQLDLAETYLSMDNIDAAKEALQEVAAFGTEAQKTKAKKILDNLNKNE